MDKSDVEKIVLWIKDYFAKNSWAKGAIVGMSGGKDSLVVAKLCAEALGRDRVLGVIMPNGDMHDINDAIESCKVIGIDYKIINISNTYKDVLDITSQVIQERSHQVNTTTSINISPRIRMTCLYAIGASLDFLVANTSNLSEYEVGYTTKWGDNVGDFAPIANFTKTEVCDIGLILGLPQNLVNKTPSDGLSGMSDEEKLGFSYANLDEFVRTGKISTDHDKIMRMHNLSQHKRLGTIRYPNDLPNYFDKNNL